MNSKISPLNPSEGLVMTPAERGRASILVVDSDSNDRNNLRTSLKSLGYGGVSDAPNHATALERMNDRRFTHVIFEAKKTNMPAKEFLGKVFEGNDSIIALPSSHEPNVDDVFDLLILGAKGYLVKPFTVDTVEQAIVSATKGEPISDAVLHAKDRNEALVAILLSSLDKAALLQRQSEKFETAKRELPRAMAVMRRSADLAKTFAKGGDAALLEAMERFCIDRSQGPASRLGRLRKKLKTGKPGITDDSDDANDSNDEAQA
jgi:DNA-binding NarL/FixJ family response regulator